MSEVLYSPIKSDALVLKIVAAMKTQPEKWWRDEEIQETVRSLYPDWNLKVRRGGGFRNQYQRHWPQSARYAVERPHGLLRVPLFEKHPSGSFWRLLPSISIGKEDADG